MTGYQIVVCSPQGIVAWIPTPARAVQDIELEARQAVRDYAGADTYKIYLGSNLVREGTA